MTHYQGFTSNDISEPALMHPSLVSVIALQSCWAAALEAGEFSTAQRRKQLLPSEIPAPAPQASLAAAQEGFVLPQCLSWVFNIIRRPTLLLWHEWPCHFPRQLCMVKWYSHPQEPVELLFIRWWLPWWKLEALLMNSCEKRASLGMIVEIMISSLSGETVLRKLK